MTFRKLICCASLAAVAIAVPAFADDSSVGEWEKLYQEALELRANGDLYGSIESLNNILAVRPTLHRARLELAVSYYRASRYEQAREQAQRVLENSDTPEGVKETISLFLEQVDSIQVADDNVRHKFEGSISFGAGYDDNVNAGPDADTFDVTDGVIILGQESTNQSDAFGSINARLSHTYRMPGSFGIGERPVQALWQSGASLYRKEYQDEHPYTVDVVSLRTGPALVSRTNWRAKLDLQADYIRLGDNALALYTSLNPSYTLVDGNSEYTFRGQWMYREYMTAENKNREGERIGLGFDYTRRLNETLLLQAGFTTYEQDARIDEQENDTHEFYLGAYWAAWDNGSLYARASFKEVDYQGEVFAYGTGRKEREQRYILGFNHNFGEGGLQGWGMGARLSYSDNHANVDIYEYDRTNFSLDITKRF